MKIRCARGGAVLVCIALSGCSGWQSALEPHGVPARQISWLIWVFTAVAAVVWVAVVAFTGAALARRTRPAAAPLDINPLWERRACVTIFALAAATLLIVLALSTLSYFVQRAVYAKSNDAITIRVVGHQWWWEVKYESPSPNRTFTTANEIHIPVGRNVVAKLETRDVIHSFWVPSLTGKVDLINNQNNEVEFTATRAGVYRGQCAEFCGLQHAHMAFEVVAAPPDEFEAWRRSQIMPAQEPSTAPERRGARVFAARGCALCHTVRGTGAGGKLGPDLTHFGSRRSVAAGSLPMNAASLAGWISDPQHIKPGAFMPPMKIDPADLIAVVAYLQSLK